MHILSPETDNGQWGWQQRWSLRQVLQGFLPYGPLYHMQTLTVQMSLYIHAVSVHCLLGVGQVVRRYRVSYVTGASKWYWLSVGQGLLFLIKGECFYFFCFFTFIPVPVSSLSLSFISSTISSISLLPFSGRWHKMTHKTWRVVKPQNHQSLFANKINGYFRIYWWTASLFKLHKNIPI